MYVWIVSVGEPLPCDGINPRLRRMGNLASFLSEDKNNRVDWFSVSFDHYRKVQRTDKDEDIQLKDNYFLHLLRVNGYKRNVSFARVVHHKKSAKRIFEKMKSATVKPDVIIASMEPLEVSHAVAEYSKLSGVPTIVDVRDLWPEIYFEVLPKPLHPLLNVYVDKCAKSLSYTMSNAKSIVGLSEGFLEYGLKYAKRPRSDLDRVIPIGYPDFDKTPYIGDYTLLSQKYGLNKDDFIVLFLGNFGDQFNFEPIIDASKRLARFPKIKFVLCGNGAHFEEVKKKTEGCNVVFTGWVDQEIIKALACNAALGIAPYIKSINYSLNTPNKFGEYLSYGLPILLGVDGLMAKLSLKNECGCVYSNGEQLANEIVSFFKDDNRLECYSRNARCLYEQTFQDIYTNQKFLELMNEVIKKED